MAFNTPEHTSIAIPKLYRAVPRAGKGKLVTRVVGWGRGGSFVGKDRLSETS